MATSTSNTPSTSGQTANSPTSGYNLPGVLHYLQVEWRRAERDRNEWEIERTDLKSQITVLESEKKALENTKLDLVRRVKMLEFSLRQERGKYTDLQRRLQPGDSSAPVDSQLTENTSDFPIPEAEESQKEPTLGALLNFTKGSGQARSKELLRNYLREVGYLLSATSGPYSNANESDLHQSPFSTNYSPEEHNGVYSDPYENIHPDAKNDESEPPAPRIVKVLQRGEPMPGQSVQMILMPVSRENGDSSEMEIVSASSSNSSQDETLTSDDGSGGKVNVAVNDDPNNPWFPNHTAPTVKRQHLNSVSESNAPDLNGGVFSEITIKK